MSLFNKGFSTRICTSETYFEGKAKFWVHLDDMTLTVRCLSFISITKFKVGNTMEITCSIIVPWTYLQYVDNRIVSYWICWYYPHQLKHANRSFVDDTGSLSIAGSSSCTLSTSRIRSTRAKKHMFGICTNRGAGTSSQSETVSGNSTRTNWEAAVDKCLVCCMFCFQK